MAHNRKLVLGGVALTMARIRPARQDAAAANRVRDELEAEVINSGFLRDAPFSWIGLIIRYGLKNEDIPHLTAVDEVDGELPMAIEIDVHRLLGASEDEMVSVYREATLRALIHAGEKFDLPVSRLRDLLAEPTR